MYNAQDEMKSIYSDNSDIITSFKIKMLPYVSCLLKDFYPFIVC